MPPSAGNNFGKYSNMIGDSTIGRKSIFVTKDKFGYCFSKIVKHDSE